MVKTLGAGIEWHEQQPCAAFLCAYGFMIMYVYVILHAIMVIVYVCV